MSTDNNIKIHYQVEFPCRGRSRTCTWTGEYVGGFDLLVAKLEAIVDEYITLAEPPSD